MTSRGPLAGVRVIELVGLGPGPFCGMVLGGLGAEIIRVDRPGSPDPGRGPLEHGKQTVRADLKTAEGVEQVLGLTDGADVLIDVFRPGVTERLGIGPDVACTRNPRLIYGRLTGYGQDGPWAHKAGHDLNYIALAGALEPLGRADGPPTAPINMLADFAGGGLLLAYGITAALHERSVSGRGQVIDAAMIDGAAMLLAPFYAGRAHGGWGPRGTNHLDGAAHFYDVYQCADGKWLAVGAIEPQFYAALLAGLGLDDEDANEQWDRTQWAAKKEKFAAVIAARTRDEWVAVFDGADACVAPVLDPVEATQHPHNVARNMFDELRPRPAPRFSRTPEQESIWPLDPTVTFLNHGSFGSCPRPVLEAQTRYRQHMEAQPVRFLMHEMEPRLDAARAELGAFVGANTDDLVFVNNATTAVNTVVRSLHFDAGDELLTTNHAYNACAVALHYVANRAGATVVVADVPFPIASPDEVVATVLDQVTERTRFALIDHITSPTGIVFPVEQLCRELTARGVEVMVDGAHAPGMIPLDVTAVGATYYTGNLHKWVCAPKGAAFLWVRPDRQAAVHPLVISHGANTVRHDRSRFQLEFGWQGTDDPTAWLCIPDALRTVAGLQPGGWPDVMVTNRALALQARDVLSGALGIPAPVPDGMLGALVSVPLPHGAEDLNATLWAEHRIEAPMMWWPAEPARVLRVSCQQYNRLEQYERLAALLRRW
jgi:isopenicillin-N epimerase